MANFTLETTRNTAFTNIPRLTFQKPQSTTGATPSTTDPILFCQTGCDLEFKFKNITSAKMKNDGAYFTITPPDNSDNYINWSGSGKAGFDMIRFDLKEIKIAAPARDVVGSITYNKSIQIYFSFVNSDENKRDIMIVISIIGQANNVGNAQTDGFILLNELANQIPVRNEIRSVTSLKNVNLGNLLPSSKAFFNTLIDTQKIYYISMARIIDIPENFLNNMISRVVGGQQAYQSKVNQNTQQIPSNPPGTFIFYSENLKTIGSDQAYVCNANCDRVVGDASLLQPKFGSSTDTRMAGTSTRTAPGAPGAPAKEIPCEEEYVYPGTKTPVKVKSASAPATSTDKSTDKSNEKELTSSELGNVWVLVAFVGMILALTGFILAAMAVASGVTSFLGFFSRELWNVPNIPFILAGLIGAISVITGVSITLVMIEQENSKSTKNEKEKKPWIGLIIGLSIWILCFIPLAIFAYKNKKSSYSSFGNSSSNYSSNSFSQQNPFALPINSTLPGFNPPKMKLFNTQADKVLSSYKSAPSPADFLKPGSSGIQEILAASKQYSQLSPIAKETMAKYNPSLVPYLNPKGQFIQNIQSQNPQLFPAQQTLQSFIESLRYYNILSQTKPVITQELIRYLRDYQKSAKNSDLEKLINNLTNTLTLNVNAPIPIEVYKYVAKI
jgi:hypothetical protein